MSRKRLLSNLGALSMVLLATLLIGDVKSPKFGDPLPNLTSAQLALFTAGKAQFQNVEGIADGLEPVIDLFWET